MKTVRIAAAFCYYLTRMAAVLFLLTGLYATVVLALKGQGFTRLPVELTDGYFTIFLPFTRQPFLLGDYNPTYIISTLSIVWLYGLFLWLLSRVFHTFRLRRFFTGSSISRLSFFYQFNFIVPLTGLLLLLIFGQEIRDAIVIAFLHLMIGMFAFFMAALFREGLVLQEEQDLTF